MSRPIETSLSPLLKGAPPLPAGTRAESGPRVDLASHEASEVNESKPPAPKRGRLLAFSGLDGAGKSTQIDLLLERLLNDGTPAHRLWIRGGYTPGFSLLKKLVRCGKPGTLPQPGRSVEREQRFQSQRTRRLWLTLAILDLMSYLGVWVRLLRWRGITVVADRYLEDTLLDFRLNFPQERVEEWWQWRLLRWLAPQPDHSFVFVVPVQESLRRSQLKAEPFPDSAEVLAARLEAYERLAASGNAQLMDGLLARETLHATVWQLSGVNA